MRTYHIHIDPKKATDYTRGEIDGIIKAIAEESDRVDPWFTWDERAIVSKRVDVDHQKIGRIIGIIERECPDTIQLVEFE